MDKLMVLIPVEAYTKLVRNTAVLDIVSRIADNEYISTKELRAVLGKETNGTDRKQNGSRFTVE